MCSTSAEPYDLRGRLLHRIKKYDKAIKSFEKCNELDPAKSETWYINVATALISLKKNKEAILACDKAIELNSNNLSAYERKGEALAGLKQYTAAYHFYNKAIEVSGFSSARTYNKKGIYFYLFCVNELELKFEFEN